MAMIRPPESSAGVPYHLGRRVALVLVPWALAAVFVVFTIDGVAFKRSSPPPGLTPGAAPGIPATPGQSAPAEPAPKSQERTIDPSERVPV